jgi:energy-converting hydrogenase A subunit M
MGLTIRSALMSAEDSLRRAEELLTKVEQARARLDSTDDPDAALDVLAQLADLAKEVEAEIQRAKREAEAEADAQR